MKNHLTTIAQLPGSGAGYMSALPAERNEAPKAETITVWPTLEEYKSTYNMNWPPITFGGPGC